MVICLLLLKDVIQSYASAEPQKPPTVCPDLVNPCMERNIPDCFWRCDVFWDVRKWIIIPLVLCSHKKRFYIFWSSLIRRPFKQAKLPRPASQMLTLCCNVFFASTFPAVPFTMMTYYLSIRVFWRGWRFHFFFCYVYVTINCKPGFVHCLFIPTIIQSWL